MRINKLFFIILFLLVGLGGAAYFFWSKRAQPQAELVKEISPEIGTIENTISTTGSVLPKNRLEVKPPVNGRLEEILVKEGEQVTQGQTLAWMSSTERAALLDAAQGQGESTLDYWKQVYKPIALISPMPGEVIVATTQPGQWVTTSDAVVVLSDRLIVQAKVDETDIGKVKVGQAATVTLDAYPDTEIDSVVDHIYYESEVVNNVTTYSVDLIPDKVPEFFRSGMNATINFIENKRDHILLVPQEALLKDNGQAYVLVKQPDGEPVKHAVVVGLSDDRNVEIVSGIDRNATLIIKTKKYSLPSNGNTGSNPFMPFRGQKKQNR